MLLLKSRSTVFVFSLVTLTLQVAQADSLGLSASMGISDGCSVSICPAPTFLTQTTGGIINQSVYGPAPLSDAFSVQGIVTTTTGLHVLSTLSGSVFAEERADGGQLGALVIAEAGAAGPGNTDHPEAISSRAAANARLQWLDTIYFVGPIGLPITVQITEDLDSFVQFIGGNQNADRGENYALSSFSLGSNRAIVNNLATDPRNGDITNVVFFNTYVGQSFQLEHQLFVSADADASLADPGLLGGGYSGEVRALNTSNGYIKVLTPGAAYLSASGATYDAPSTATPEPSSWLLIATALLAIAIRMLPLNKAIPARKNAV